MTLLPIEHQHPNRAAVAWLEEEQAKIEKVQRDNLCPNLHAPAEWFDYSVKVRGEEKKNDASCANPSSPGSLMKRDEYSCDENNPCGNGACCGTGGYCGFGEKYCGDGTTPNANCWSNCDAKAECGINAKVVNTTCPLNVCCSQYGFCGTTDEFCKEECQSNCDMPDGSGESGGDVQTRVVGYYEGWKVSDSCAAMNLKMKNIPLASLTHLIVSFGYVTADDYNLEPMPGVSEDTLSGFTAIKKDNPSTKIMISLGGWSFTDNDTDTQAVFTTMVSSQSNRATFIDNLMDFLSHYGFDGVDFDWEYPGASDRGGHDTDAEGYMNLLKEFQEAMDDDNKDYVVSFTTPTSFYYLQNYEIDGKKDSNLKKMTEYADFVNVMSYDLHGTWDGPKDKIGSIVLAHTNLTEIENAFDLFWRVGVDPSKLNLGMGFYGRSYQLSDPSCYQPGCPFSGGANAGSCTGQSGILSYKEIMQIIDKNDITATWDEVAAVKYITWNDDQWVSFDDKETFQQKIKWANSNGIGGLAIWALDQDTDDLEALQALLYPKTLNAFYDNTTESSNWQQVQGGQCRVTDCGVQSCKTGEVHITTQQCSSKHGTAGQSQLCCPVSSAPDPSTCTWRGNPRPCNGRCHENEVALEQNPWGGGGDKCTDGNKVYCCPLPTGLESNCRTTDCGGDCNDDENSIAGEFWDNCFLNPKKLCCPKDSPYQEDVCHWQGKDGSCYDNVCAFNTEVQLTQSYDGGDAPGGTQPFLPVPLEYLFKDPPTNDGADVEYKLSVDDTWGGSSVLGDDDTPNDASFGFFVMTSPEEIQISLKKRDSHWEVFDCNDAVSEEAQTIRMFCNDNSSRSNCNKIRLGHGVPGTILEMPNGCGPGPYAVAVDMVPSENQTVPGHIKKRTTDPDPVIYDLTFDYDFRRVPRDLGDTQFRLDYSNEEGYWDTVVDSPGQKRRKRSFEEHGGTHKRYLEDSWTADLDDHRAGLMTRDELHARWFGSDALAWIKSFFTVEAETTPITHSVSETLNVILLDESYQCTIAGVDTAAKLLVKAQTTVNIDTSFGLTVIAKLGDSASSLIDLSQSYLWFKNSGNVQALFNIDALVSAKYDTKDIELFGLQNFGATFSIPGIVTVGPNFKIYGSVNFDLSLSGNFEAHVTIADWDTQLAFPEAEDEADPKANETPTTKGTQEVGEPTIDWGIDANGQITAHVKPVASFGLEWNSKFISIDPATVNLIADGWVQAYASAHYGSDDPDFCYGANAGSKLSVDISVPDQIGWLLPKSITPYDIWTSPTWAIIDKTCSSSIPDTNDNDKRDIVDYDYIYGPDISKRSVTIGPLIHIPKLSCPSSANASTGTAEGCPICGENLEDDDDTSVESRSIPLYKRADDDDDACEFVASGDSGQVSCRFGSSVTKRFFGDESAELYEAGALWDDNDEVYNSSAHHLEKRLTSKVIWIKIGGVDYGLDFGHYSECGEAKGQSTIDKCYLFETSGANCNTNMRKLTNAQAAAAAPGVGFDTDHVYEAQSFADFISWLADGAALGGGWQKPTAAWVGQALLGDSRNGPAFALVAPPGSATNLRTPAAGDSPDNVMLYGFGRSDGTIYNARFTRARGQKQLALTYEEINGRKGTWFGSGTPSIWSSTSTNVMSSQNSRNKVALRIRNSAGVFSYLNYQPTDGSEPIWDKWMRTSNWIDLVCHVFDQQYTAGTIAGEPVNPNGGGALRSLYAKFIDMHLNSIETTAAAWSTWAAGQYDNTFGQDAWYTTAFGNNGFATGNSLRFPRVAGVAGASVFGAYANGAMTLDGAGNVVNNIGVPAAIP
ncbi:hypothetical protein E8E14_001381 [Neopestalotiopsis sp. 37M]|nr:hypothetical protein E8E14_001381 [Neopestalotiopsis sp. 37M]